MSRRQVGIVAVLLLGFAGCAQSGPERYELSGKITFQGQPVAAGMMILEPDPAQGAAGPAALAIIEQGAFKTLPDQGVVGGPHLVRILAGNGVHVGPLRPYGVPYVPHEVQTTAALPYEDATWNFDIPPSSSVPTR